MKKALLIFVSYLMVACTGNEKEPFTFSSARLMEDIKVLSSDEFEGRAPSSLGEEKTLEYLTKVMTEIGTKPGNGDSFLQKVPLMAYESNKSSNLTFISATGDSTKLSFGQDFVGWTKKMSESVMLDNSEVVFVGYGVNAPEYNWNDYEGIDVTGKTVLILVNDPGYATGIDSLFTGKAMTYYGRWTYKFEEAARQGAKAALIIHQTGPAGYPWEVVTGSWTGQQFGLVPADGQGTGCDLEGWVTQETATKLFASSGLDLNTAIMEAAEQNFIPKSLALNLKGSLINSYSQSSSNNFIAKIEGTKYPNEYLIYSAHWDHLGKDTSLDGDQIYNGAIDNATGTAGLIELARGFIANPPERSVLFLFVTAEEKGLLGSAYYAQNPVYPANQTVAVINIDGLNMNGKMSDITVVGYGNSELDRYVDTVAASQNRVVSPESEPEKGYFFRSDHFSFAKEGIPALYTESGVNSIEHGKEWTLKQNEEYVAIRYHKPADEFSENWNTEGAIDDLSLFYTIGSKIANSSVWPQWNEGVAFKAKRDSMMQ